ncbi:MAG: Ig-like domain-containing protein [Nitrospinae bacterium]|nr:Ig-like domain-containing protein [Nitrospinota bacterium]
MKKILGFSSVILLFAIISIAGVSGCGSELNSNNTDKKIKVTIPFDLSEKSLQKSNQTGNPNQFYGPAPSNVRSIRVDAVYRDGRKISSTIDVAGGTYVEANMEVDAGDYVFFNAFAYDGTGGTGNLLYLGASSPQTLVMGMSYDILIQMSANNNTPPAVSSVSPSNGATGVPTSSILTVIFSKPMDPSTISSSSSSAITSSPSINCGGTTTYSGTTATCTPSPALSPNTTYTITFTTGVKDLAGNAMASSYTWSFTTGADGGGGGGGGTSLPSAFSFSLPLNGSQGVSLTPTLSWADSVGETSYAIEIATDPGFTAMAHSATVGTDIISYTVSTGLSPSITYYWRVKAINSYGATTVSNSPFTFTTTSGGGGGGGGDTTPPTVSSVSPVSGATSVPTSSIITIIFSEAMTSSSITTSTIILSPNPGYSVNYSSGTATITPTTLSSSTTYTVTIKTGVKDSAGNAMTSDYSWSFTTAGGGDTTPPTVSSVSPASGATGVTPSGIITIIFSEAMTSSSITTSTITVIPVFAGFTVSYSGTTATVTPTWSGTTTYTVTVTTGVKDAAGNAMTSPYSWSFTTSP